MTQFSGMTWTYRNDSVQIGELTPVSCYTVSTTDPTPTTPEACGHIWTGYAEVSGWAETPDAEYRAGNRREMLVHGPVVNRARTVVIDDAPTYSRESG